MPRKTHRITVNLPLNLSGAASKIATENGASMSATVADLMSAGLDKTTLADRISALEKLIKSRPEPSNSGSISAPDLARLEAQIAALAASNSGGGGGLTIPIEAAKVLFERVYFAAHLTAACASGQGERLQWPSQAAVRARADAQRWVDEHFKG